MTPPSGSKAEAFFLGAMNYRPQPRDPCLPAIKAEKASGRIGMNGDGSEKIDDGTVDGAPPRAGICRCFALTHCRSAGIKPILKCLLFCPYRNTVREHDPPVTRTPRLADGNR